MKKTAILTGISGMDAPLLAEQLLDKDYKVYGLLRRTSSASLGNADYLANDIEIVEGDITDLSCMLRLCKLANANEFYNFASQSHVGISFEQPITTAEITGVGVLNCLEAIRLSGVHTRFYQASTSELYGGMLTKDIYASETTPFHPRSPYGVAKMMGYWATVNYREAYKMFACNGILFNHEHFFRGPNFVTRKITLAAANIKAGKQDKLYLGNLEAKRDWGWAPDYVNGAWLMLNHTHPDDYVLATGETHTVKDFCDAAFSHLDLDYRDYVEIDPRFYRPAEVDVLIGNPSKARNVLGWKTSISFKELVSKMVDHDYQTIAAQK